MAMIGKFLIATLLACLSIPALAQTRFNKGFIQVRPDRQLYFEHVHALRGQPTVILLNGLTYSVHQYDAFTRELIRRGLGVIRFDFDGMGQSLLRYAPSTAPYAFDQQAKDTRTLLAALGQRPPFNLVGLSYGGGIEVAYSLLFPRDIGNLILIAPYTEPLASQDQWIRWQIQMARTTNPGNPASDEELYDYFLRLHVYSTYPTAEPIVLENPFKLEATYNLVRGIRKFRPVDHAHKLVPGTVHLMTAVFDQYIPTAVLENFWSRVPQRARMSRIKVYETEHKMPEAVPAFTAAWVNEIIRGNPVLRQGRDFEGWPTRMRVRTGNQEFEIK